MLTKALAEPLPAALIADRYRVEQQLGRGGMAVVYKVHDRITERTLALKRLTAQDTQSSHVAELFEREYQTLSQLVHPRIIEVYDYHTDEIGPFYTMELLSGGDLRQAAPIPWAHCCRLLCDVGSALALLHSRRFVHRDLTPLNIRCTGDGRAKLFDFGSMAQFGRSKHVVGTPPFVAPEALHGQALDGQTDLFALGATLYYALTGRHAYPARMLSELNDLWQRAPAPPSQLVSGIPRELDELVLELLQLRAAERPSSAAVVIERLSAIGGFELHEALLVEQAYLVTPSLVGRDEGLAAIRRQLRRAESGRGSSVMLLGSDGSGRSRFLDACALEAKLVGGLVLRADLEASGGRSWGAAAALLVQLCEQARELALPALRARMAVLGPLLARVDADLPAELELPAEGAPEPTRAQLQSELRELLLELTDHRLLVVAVDDVDRIDEPSSALLSLLANQSRDRRLLVLSTAHTVLVEQRSLTLLQSVSDTVRVRSLDASQTAELVISLFGDVPNVQWLAARIHAVTRGKPRLIMHVARHLVARGSCRYERGDWTLPSRLENDELSAALNERIDPSLSASALELARVLALWGPERLSSAECLRLAEHGDRLRLQADLVSLAAAGIVTLDDDGVSLSRASWEPLLLRDRTPVQLRALHLQLAGFLERPKQHPKEVFRLVQHLLAAGEQGRAVDAMITLLAENRERQLSDPLLTYEYIQSLPKKWPATFHAVVEGTRTLGRPKCEAMLIEISLLAYTTFTARSEPCLLRELLAQLRHDAGLDLIAALAREVPASELLTRALTQAQRRYDATLAHERGVTLIEAITWLAQLTTQTVGMAVRGFDLPLLHALPPLTPLAALSPALAIVQDNVDCSINMVCGRTDQARRRYLEILARLEQPDGGGLTGTHHNQMRLAVIQGVAALDASAGRPRALERAEELDSEPLHLITAQRIRAVYALARGDRQRAEAHRAQIELLLIQNSPPQLFEGTQNFQWLMGYFFIGDLLRVKQCVAEIEESAREHVGWQPIAHYGRGAYQALRGDHAQALQEFERTLASVRAGEHLVWQWCAGALLWSLVHQGRHADAAERGRALLEQSAGAELQPTSHALLVPLAAALDALGESARAIEHSEAAIALLREGGGGGVLLGAAYDVRARIALSRRDAGEFRHYADLCLEEYRAGGLGSLLARHERLMRAGRQAALLPAEPAVREDSGLHANADIRSTVATVLFNAKGPMERAARALALLGQATRSPAGFLYLIQRRGPALVAQLGAVAPLLDLDDLVINFLQDALDKADVTATDHQQHASSGGVNASSNHGWTATEGARFSPLLISHTNERGLRVTGAAVMWFPNASNVRVPSRLLHALSEALHEAGDITTQLGGELASELHRRVSHAPR